MNAPARPFAPHRFTVEDVRAMAGAGVLDSDQKLELIDGVLIEMPHDGPRNIDYSIALGEWLYRSLGGGYAIVPDKTLVLSDYNAPKPDWYVFPASLDTANVRGADVLLAIEQSDSSLSRDLGEKAVLYASHGVRDYWVIDVEKRQVHVHRDPAPEGYGTKHRFEAHESVAAMLVPGLALKLAELGRVG